MGKRNRFKFTKR